MTDDPHLTIRVSPDAGASHRSRAAMLADAWGNASIFDRVGVLDSDGPVYYIDCLTEAARDNLRFRSRVFALDTGDEASSLYESVHGLGPKSLARRLVETILRKRARAIVHRGALHGYQFSPRVREAARTIYLPDLAVLNLDTGGWARPRTSAEFVLGFIGSSQASRTTPPSGWHIIEWLQRNDSQARLLVAGSGVEVLKQRAVELGVMDRVRFSSDFERAAEFVRPVSAYYLPQTSNRIAQARTTGKLVEYLHTGRLIFTAAVGTAGATLPSTMLMRPAVLAGTDQVDELQRLAEQWIEPDSDWVAASNEIRQVAQMVDPIPRLEYWKASLRQLLNRARHTSV